MGTNGGSLKNGGGERKEMRGRGRTWCGDRVRGDSHSPGNKHPKEKRVKTLKGRERCRNERGTGGDYYTLWCRRIFAVEVDGESTIEALEKKKKNLEKGKFGRIKGNWKGGWKD